jgi:hypothetical protein
MGFVIEMGFERYLVRTFALFMIPVERKLIGYIQADQQKAGKPGRETKEINCTERFVPDKITEQDFKIVSEHDSGRGL